MIGEQVGNFKIIAQLGKGGMGEVYLAEHTGRGTRVAIKMLLSHVSANEDLVQRFFNEAIAVGKIQHAGTGKIFDSGHHAGRAYLVMEFLPGETLGSRIRRMRRLPIAHVGELGKQIAGVLEAVHKAGITHRDLKPDNIFIVPDDELGSGERIKIVDFGIAKLSGIGGGLTATTTGALGTPAYMSPEQWKNAKHVDWRADAYSLGCLTFEMVAGRPPFIAETLGEACAKHLTEDPPRLASVIAVPPALDSLIASLLEKSPEQRPASMRDIAQAFGAIAAAAPVDLGSTQRSGQIAIGPLLGATQGTNVPIDQMTQATQATQASMTPTPPPTRPSEPPPLSSTTLGTASAQLVTRPKRGVPLWIVIGLGAALAGMIAVLAIVLSKGGKDDAPSISVVDIDARPTVTTTPDAAPVRVIEDAAAAVANPAPRVQTVPTTPPRQPYRPFTGSAAPTTSKLEITGSPPRPLPDKLPPRAIEATIKLKAWSELFACARANPGGSVTIEVAVGPTGQPNIVRDISQQRTTRGACMVAVIGKVRFPASSKGGTERPIYNFATP